MLLCAIEIFNKCDWVKPVTNKKINAILDGFNKIANESKRKPNKFWVDQERELYNKLM